MTIINVWGKIDSASDHLKAFFIDYTHLDKFQEYDVGVKVKVDKVRFRGSKEFIKI